MRILAGTKQQFWKLTFSPDGTQLAVGGSAARAYLWDLATEKATGMLKGGGPLIHVEFWEGHLVGVGNKSDLRIRNLATGIERSVPSGMLYITGVVVVPQLRMLIGVGANPQWQRGVWAWTLPDFQPAWDYRGREAGLYPYALAISPNGETLAVAGASGIYEFNPRDGKPRDPLSAASPNVRRMAYSPDGRWLAAAAETHLHVCDISTGVQVLDVPNGRRHWFATAFSPDSRLLAACSADETVRIYRTDTWNEAADFNWGIGPVRDVVFSPDGMRAAAGGDKGQIVLWDIDL
jgi:WD40 repeat protein